MITKDFQISSSDFRHVIIDDIFRRFKLNDNYRTLEVQHGSGYLPKTMISPYYDPIQNPKIIVISSMWQKVAGQYEKV